MKETAGLRATAVLDAGLHRRVAEWKPTRMRVGTHSPADIPMRNPIATARDPEPLADPAGTDRRGASPPAEPRVLAVSTVVAASTEAEAMVEVADVDNFDRRPGPANKLRTERLQCEA